MNLIGEYTLAGAQLAARLINGQAELSILGATAGAGHTPPEAGQLMAPRQILELLPHSLLGATLTVPARLRSFEAEAPYVLSEIGLYAQEAGGAPILYKIFRFDQPIAISPDCGLTATFYLNDTVVAGSPVQVQVSPSGLLSREEAEGLIGGIGPFDPSKSQTLTCAAAGLQGLLDGLPRLITGDLRVEVTGGGTAAGNLRIHGFFGPGTLHIVGQSRFTVAGYADLYVCRPSLLTLENITLAGEQLRPSGVTVIAGGITLTNEGAVLTVRDCPRLIRLNGVTVAMPADVNGLGYFIQRSRCVMEGISAPKRKASVLAHDGSTAFLNSFAAQGTASSTRAILAYGASHAYFPGNSTTAGNEHPAGFGAGNNARIFFTTSTVY